LGVLVSLEVSGYLGHLKGFMGIFDHFEVMRVFSSF